MEETDREMVRLKLAITSGISSAATTAPPPPTTTTTTSFLTPPPTSSFLLRQFTPPPSQPRPQPHSQPTSSDSSSPSPGSGKASGPIRPSRARKSPLNNLRQGKSATIPAPYPWATTERAKVRSLKDLLSTGIEKIEGDVHCKRCERDYKIEYDLQEKFHEFDTFFNGNMENMHDRAPASWMSPPLLNCDRCGNFNCVKPIMGKKKRSINWLFLFLGQMLGYCKLAELKYFCKHSNHHRTGAKDRVLFLTYVALRKQLQAISPS